MALEAQLVQVLASLQPLYNILVTDFLVHLVDLGLDVCVCFPFLLWALNHLQTPSHEHSQLAGELVTDDSRLVGQLGELQLGKCVELLHQVPELLFADITIEVFFAVSEALAGLAVHRLLLLVTAAGLFQVMSSPHLE